MNVIRHFLHHVLFEKMWYVRKGKMTHEEWMLHKTFSMYEVVFGIKCMCRQSIWESVIQL